MRWRLSDGQMDRYRLSPGWGGLTAGSGPTWAKTLGLGEGKERRVKQVAEEAGAGPCADEGSDAPGYCVVWSLREQGSGAPLRPGQPSRKETTAARNREKRGSHTDSFRAVGSLVKNRSQAGEQLPPWLRVCSAPCVT